MSFVNLSTSRPISLAIAMNLSARQVLLVLEELLVHLEELALGAAAIAASAAGIAFGCIASGCIL
jgi:hypothetical protein